MKEFIINKVNRIFNCDVLAKSRKKANVNGRVAFTAYLKKYTELNCGEIGKIFNKKHCMIYRYLENHEYFYKYDKEYRKMFDELEFRQLNPITICNQSVFTFRTYRRK